jgi:hypothetical protein
MSKLNTKKLKSQGMKNAFYSLFDKLLKIFLSYFYLQDKIVKDPSVTDAITADDLQSNPLYFTRTKGLFRVCFPTKDLPNTSKGNKQQFNTHTLIFLVLTFLAIRKQQSTIKEGAVKMK